MKDREEIHQRLWCSHTQNIDSVESVCYILDLYICGYVCMGSDFEALIEL